ncbi:MAG TPA: glycerol-3-phosphate dehydrogenase, partial [Arenibaculum sp.]|nr:glycerol-3-phosphate dehydrogenase [Arenibaculum sp.]
DGAWTAEIRSVETGEAREVRARGLVNAAGPWVAEVLNARIGTGTRHSVRLVKGSHVVVPRLFDGDHAYIFQNDDRRIVFAIPYERRFTLIGTTDVDYQGDPGQAHITREEIDYLCRAVSRYFTRAVGPDQVVWTYSGVRPLYDDDAGSASAVTRDYVLELTAPDGQPPLLSVYGGKITTFRRLAEEAVNRIQEPLGHAGRPWTGRACLPGGDIEGADFDGLLAGLAGRYPWLPAGLLRRYARAYGTRTEVLLNGAHALADLGRNVAGREAAAGDTDGGASAVFEAELRYAAAYEFVTHADDFLWRRSKLGLHLDEAGRDAVAGWFADWFAGRAPAHDIDEQAAPGRSLAGRSSVGGNR